MKMFGIGAGLAAAVFLGACSKAEEAAQIQNAAEPLRDFTPTSRAEVEGALLRLGEGGRIGLIDVQAAGDGSERLFAETILLQRQPAGTGVEAVSQVVEIDCKGHQHRIIANLGYRRDGALVRTIPVETEFTGMPVYQELYDRVCDGSFGQLTVARFGSIAEFLDLFEGTQDGSRPTLRLALAPEG